MGNISVSLPSDGETIDASDYNTPINTIVNEINGGLDNSNIATDAAISGSKIADGTITSDTLAQNAVPIKIGVIPGSTFGTTGNKSITGVGFTPQLVRFTTLNTANATASNLGIGSMTSTGQFYSLTYTTDSPNAGRVSGTDGCIGYMSGASTIAMKASYVSMDTDGFTINVSTATGAYDIAYEAYG